MRTEKNRVAVPTSVAVLPASFYRRDAAEVAPDLLGKVLVGRVAGRLRRARITETEAYVGPHDLASHSRHGPTQRNKAMFGPAGRAYVYLVYGVHHCMNVVCGDRDGQAVLLRAAAPLDDWDARLAGPGLLARAFGLDLAANHASLQTGPLRIHDGPAPRRIAVGPRIGVQYAGPWAKAPLRFMADAP